MSRSQNGGQHGVVLFYLLFFFTQTEWACFFLCGLSMTRGVGIQPLLYLDTTPDRRPERYRRSATHFLWVGIDGGMWLGVSMARHQAGLEAFKVTSFVPSKTGVFFLSLLQRQALALKMWMRPVELFIL
jgi:hypothetical protein